MKLSAAAKGMGLVTVTGAFVHAVPSVTALATVRRFTPRLSGRGRADHIALTFDDGPDAASTPEFLDRLATLGVHATFFMLGEQVVANRQVAQRVVAEGHEVGLHGWHHRNSLGVTPGALRASMVRAIEELQTTAGIRPRWYRPPFGIATAGTYWATRSLGLTPVLWNAWGHEWTPGATAADVVETMRRDAHGGSTVLLHDSDHTSPAGSWKTALEALDPLIAQWRAEGIQVGPLRDHGITPR